MHTDTHTHTDAPTCTQYTRTNKKKADGQQHIDMAHLADISLEENVCVCVCALRTACAVSDCVKECGPAGKMLLEAFLSVI